MLILYDDYHDALAGVFRAICDYPGRDEVEIVVVGSSHVSRHRVRELPVDATEPALIACLAEWGDVGLDPTGDREMAP